jgi:outer membrane receptor protein involved in Fe transport
LVVLNALDDAFQPYVARVDDVLPWIGPAIAFGQAIGPAAAPAAQYPNGIPAWFNRGFLEAVGVATNNGVPIAIEGNRIPEASKHRIHLAASYTWDVAGGSLTARWDYYWQDHFFTRAFNQDFDKVDSWDQHNASVTYERADNRWSLRAWVRNIEDDVHITGGQRSIAREFAVSEPRTFGASLRYNFGSL